MSSPSDASPPTDNPKPPVTTEATAQKEVSRRLMALNNRRITRYVSELFHLRDDADEEGTIADIKRSIEFRGANLWALVFAVLIASVGLNMNSTAVIIGAMLISPLMGPIMGMGLSLGTNDIELFKRSMRNLGVAVFIAVLTSALYFVITPLDQAQSELLARTQPTIFDVLIAIFGGSIGIIASSRKEKTNAIPGVAIATALMPPLCTAGYGLANAQWAYFFGAFYLFFINSVFICLTTFVFVRLLRFKPVSFLNPSHEKRVRFYLGLFAVLTIIPSVYAGISVVQETLFQSRTEQFVAQNFQFKDTQIIKQEAVFNHKQPTLRLMLMGEPLSSKEQDLLVSQLPNYKLSNTQLILQQPSKGSAEIQKEFSDMNQNLRVGIVEDLYKKNTELLETKEKALQQQQEQVKKLEQQIMALQSNAYPGEQIMAELAIEFPEVKNVVIDKVQRFERNNAKVLSVGLVNWSKAPEEGVKKRLQAYLRVRLKAPDLELWHN